ncbi:galactokinase [Pedobacter aquatilis]|uniref:galactokinase n=1 Tax=Pedobacter aquatilis TaxID=351343 RepID=UPI00292D4DB0|nr:galactokinase [Pedobacter aquatilis]
MLLKIQDNFKEIFGGDAIVVRSPGRINLIGEHTDYNGGFVLPAAIDKYAYVAIAKRSDNIIKLFAESYQEYHETNISTVKTSEKGWPNYVLGVADQFIKKGVELGGFNLYLVGDIPTGAGLSSSAAVECATAYALAKLFDIQIESMELALLAQKAEHVFAGVRCGIMDQFASVFGKEKHVVKLDCNTLEYQYVPLNLKGYQLVLLNTNVKHKLAESAYNDRRNQCEQGLKWVQEQHPEIKTISETTPELLEKYVLPHDENVFRKCSYVIAENERLEGVIKDLQNGDLKALGEKLYQTHQGLSVEYDVSCKELDFLVDKTKQLPQVLGARMMGGGFGGCTLNLVADEFVADFEQIMKSAYDGKFENKLSVYAVNIASGTSEIFMPKKLKSQEA